MEYSYINNVDVLKFQRKTKCKDAKKFIEDFLLDFQDKR